MARTSATVLIGVLAVLALAPAAQAGTVEVRFVRTEAIPPEPKASGGGSYDVYELLFTSAPGEVSDLSVSPVVASPAGVAMSDKTAPITPGANCRAEAGSVICAPPRSGSVIGDRIFDLGDGDDAATFFGAPATVKLGPGKDRLRAELPGSSIGFRVVADGGPGPDTMDGDQPGRITATYADRTAAVSATLDDVANDGEAGEGDQLGLGVNQVLGGSGPDTLTGGARIDNLQGGPGNDTINGLGEVDAVIGGEGDDVLDGGAGDEAFSPEPGADVVRGGAGTDRMSYERESDTAPVSVTLDDQPGDGVVGENDNVGTDVENLRGGNGDDRLVGSDGPNDLDGRKGSDFADGRGGDDILSGDTDIAQNTLVGGSGRDRFTVVGLLDKVLAVDGEADSVSCEDRGIAPIEGDELDTGLGCIEGFEVPSNKRRIAVDRRGRIRMRVGCQDNGVPCAGSVALLARDARTRRGAGRVLGRAKMTITGDDARVVRVRLTRRTLRYLRAHPRLRATASFTTTRTLPAETRTRGQVVTLLAPRR